MATDPRHNVRPGEKLRIAAEQINWINRQMRADTGFKAGELEGYEPGRNIILARNNTGADLPRWGVMRISGIEVNPATDAKGRRSFEEMPCITGAKPNTTTGGKFVIAVEPIKSGKIGRVSAAGIVQAKVSFSSASHTRAKPKNDTVDHLESADDGPAAILWSADTTGEQWAIVRIDEDTRLLVGKVSDDWPIRTCATVTLWERTGNNCLPTKRSPTQIIENVVNLTQHVDADSWVIITKAPDGRWYLVETENNPIRVGKVSADWKVGTCASVTLWERGGTGCMPAAKSPTKIIENVVNLTQFVPADGWVVIARAPDGKWYLVESEGNPLRIGKTGSQWSKNTTASITLWEGGTPPNETVGGGTIENVVNKWSNVPADTFVGIQRGINGQYYLVVAEC